MELIPYYPTRGVNLLTDPLRLGMDEAVALKNLYPTLAGKLAKRKGCAYDSWVPDSFFGFNPQNLVPTNFEVPAFSKGALVTSLVHDTTGQTYVVINNSNLSPAYTCINFPGNNARPPMCSFGRYVLISAGRGLGGEPYNTFGCIWVVYYDVDNGRLAFLPGHSSGTPRPAGPVFRDKNGKNYAPSVMAPYRGRMVYAGFEPPFEDVLVFSDTGTYDRIETGPDYNLIVLDDSARTLTIAGLKGQKITALIDTAVSGVAGPAQTQLVILTEHTCFVMSDEPTLTTEVVGRLPTFVKIQYECGCVSQNTVARTPAGLLWASWNDVWAMDYGGIPRRVGTKIRPALLGAAAGNRHLWHAVYDHETGSYRLAITGQAQDLEAIKNPLPHQWWLDVRNGLPQSAADAAWFGPHTYRVACEVATSGVQGTFIMKTVERAGEPAVILSPYMVRHPDSVTSLRSLAFAKMDAQVGYDSCKPRYRPSDGTDLDNAYEEKDNEISWEILTPRISLGDLSVDKTYEGLELSVWANDILAMGVEVFVDGGRQVDDEYITIPQTGFILDVDSLDDTRATHEYQSVTIHPDPAQRFTGKDFQLRIYDKPGFPLTTEGMAREIIVNRGGQNIVVNADAPDLAHPLWYADLLAFLSVIAASISTVLGSTVYSSVVSNKARLTNGGGTPWSWQGFAGPTASQRSSRKVGAMAGFLPNLPATELGTGVGVTVGATASVHRKLSTDAEIAAMFIRTSFFRRRPGGKRYEPEIP